MTAQGQWWTSELICRRQGNSDGHKVCSERVLGQWWPPKGVVTLVDKEKDLGGAPVACKWAVPLHCCTVPPDCLLTLSTWGSKDLKSLNSGKSRILWRVLQCYVIALGSVSVALGFVPVHIPGGYDISPQCLPWAAAECAQCSVLNKSCQKRYIHQQGSLRSIYL